MPVPHAQCDQQSSVTFLPALNTSRVLWLTVSLLFLPTICYSQEKSPSPSPGRPIVVLQPPKPSSTDVDNLLIREVVRQAFLLTTREEFHAMTRDLAVREHQEANSADEFVFRIEVQHPDLEHVRVQVELINSVRQVPPWTAEFTGSHEKQLESALAQSATWTQHEFVDWLKSVNLPIAPVPEKNPAIDFAETIPLEFVSQIGMLRELHAALLHKPDSPRLLARIAQVYALLGSVTEIHWGCESKMFQARSLLYAQRAVRSGPNDADAAWGTSLAWGLCGRNDLCAMEIELAQSLPPSTAPLSSSVPLWGEALRDFVRWDDDALKVHVENSVPLAAYFRFRAMEMCGSSKQRIDAAIAVMTLHSECLRAAATVADEEHLGLRQRVGTTQLNQYLATFPSDLLRFSELPKSVREAAENASEAADEVLDLTATLVATLRQIPSTDDLGEPSLSLLGTLASNLHFVHVIQILQTQQYTYGIDATASANHYEELLRDHPAKAFLHVFQSDSASAQHALNIAGKAIIYLPASEASWRVMEKLKWLQAAAQRQLSAMIRSERDDIVPDLIAKLNNPISETETRDTLKTLDRISPTCPEALITHISLDWETVQSQAEVLIEKTDNSRILRAFANRYEMTAYASEADRISALRCWKKIAEIEPSNESYQEVADHYKKFEQDDLWKETLLSCLEMEDLGLQHASVHSTLANWHMERQEWQEAKPYALAAAESYSEWGLMCASRCMEGLQDWAAAEKFARNSSQRYSDGWLEWYLFCQRTGHGDLDAARRHCEQTIENMSSYQKTTSQQLGIFTQLEGQIELAARDYRRFALTAQDDRGYWSTLNMLLSGEIGKKAERDKVITELINKTGKQYPGFIAEQLQRPLDSAAPPLSNAELEFLYGFSVCHGDGTNWAYFIAKVLQQRKKPREAIEWLKRAASSPVTTKWSCTLATVELRRLKESIPQRRAAELDPDLVPALKLINKGLIYRDHKFYDLATQKFEEAIALAPDWPVSHFQLANVAFWENDFSKSDAEFTKTLEIVPQQPFILLLRGSTREALHDREGAMADYELTRKIAPNYRVARSRIESLKNASEAKK